MSRLSLFALITACWGVALTSVQAQESTPDAGAAPAVDIRDKAEEVLGQTREKVGEFATQVNESEKAKEVTAGILQPIYTIAGKLSFPAFHWLAFALMATGVVSFALQLVLGKLAVLSRAGFSFTEIISDVQGLAISVIGLVLTTQAAAQNSSFTQSPFAVLSASAVGVVLGFLFYRWGQAQELQASAGRGIPAVVEQVATTPPRKR